MRPVLLIVGSNPSFSDPNGVLTDKSASGRRLKEWLTILNPRQEYDVQCVNVSDQVGNGFHISRRHMELDRLADMHGRATATIALGHVATRGLSTFTADYLTMYHPSGLNRKLNNKLELQNKLHMLATVLNDRLNEAKKVLHKG